MSQNYGYGQGGYPPPQGYDAYGRPIYPSQPYGMDPNAAGFNYNPNAQAFYPGGRQGGYQGQHHPGYQQYGHAQQYGMHPGYQQQGYYQQGYQQQYGDPRQGMHGGYQQRGYHPQQQRPQHQPQHQQPQPAVNQVPQGPPQRPQVEQGRPQAVARQEGGQNQPSAQVAPAPRQQSQPASAAPSPPNVQQVAPPAAQAAQPAAKAEWENEIDDDDDEDAPDADEYFSSKQKVTGSSKVANSTSNGTAVVASLATAEKKEEKEVIEEISQKIEEVELEDDKAEESEEQRLEAIKGLLGELEKEDSREHVNLVMIGHVDAGKSTLCGQILFLTENVDKRTIERYEKEAKDKNRESWYFAYVMDINEEEKAKGKTVEVGRAHFETAKKRFTILDAPGHKNYVPNMIMGTAQADVGVLVIAARKGEFETGFERGGQTREHAQLAKTLGVTRLVVVVNKMDDPSVLEDGKWSQTRFKQIEGQLTPFLKSAGYNPKRDIRFVPVSGMSGLNIKETVSKDMCPWWDGGSLFEVLDSLEPTERNPFGPIRLPVADRFKDMGVMVLGKLEQGVLRVDDRLVVQPGSKLARVQQLWRDEVEVKAVKPGENCRLKVGGVEEEDMLPGFMLSSTWKPAPVANKFEAQVMVLDLLEHKSVFSPGYKCVLHLHAAVEECQVERIVEAIDPKTKERKKARFVTSNSMCICRIDISRSLPVEKFDTLAQLGRFTLRDEGRTIAIGKVTRVPKQAPSS